MSVPTFPSVVTTKHVIVGASGGSNLSRDISSEPVDACRIFLRFVYELGPAFAHFLAFKIKGSAGVELLINLKVDLRLDF